MSETATQESVTATSDPVASEKRAHVVWELLRIATGWTFLWAFLDKLFGFGVSTCGDTMNDAGETIAGEVMCDLAFLAGGAPTYGVLEFATESSKTGDLFSWMAPAGPFSQSVVDYLFMFGLGAIGLSLLFGFMVRIGAIACVVMYVFMYLAIAVFPENNPIWDDHLLGALVAVGLIFGNAGSTLGVGSAWRKVSFVEPRPYLY